MLINEKFLFLFLLIFQMSWASTQPLEEVEQFLQVTNFDHKIVRSRNVEFSAWPAKCLLFFSATSGAWRDKTFVIKTNDGGPETDPDRL
jgi:hypothetical protein